MNYVDDWATSHRASPQQLARLLGPPIEEAGAIYYANTNPVEKMFRLGSMTEMSKLVPLDELRDANRWNAQEFGATPMYSYRRFVLANGRVTRSERGNRRLSTNSPGAQE